VSCRGDGVNKKWLLYGGGALVLVALYLWYRNYEANAAASSSDTSDSTGVTADQEASDYANLATALQQDEANISALQTAQANSTVASTTPTPDATETSILADLTSIMAGQAAEPATAPAAPAAAPAPVVNVYTAAPNGSTPTPSSSGAVAAVSHAPSGTPSVLGQTQTVIAQIENLTKQGFRKISGTTQAGASPYTGTYVKGTVKYFVWGGGAGQQPLSIRKA